MMGIKRLAWEMLWEMMHVKYGFKTNSINTCSVLSFHCYRFNLCSWLGCRSLDILANYRRAGSLSCPLPPPLRPSILIYICPPNCSNIQSGTVDSGSFHEQLHFLHGSHFSLPSGLPPAPLHCASLPLEVSVLVDLFWWSECLPCLRTKAYRLWSQYAHHCPTSC